MRTLQTILIMTLFPMAIEGFSQMIEQSSQYKNLSKDSLVQIAKEQLAPLIENKGGNIEHIDLSIYQTTVMANDNSIMVSFALPIKYLPCNTSFYGNMVVDIINQTSHIQQISNPKIFKKNPVFYTSSDQGDVAVKFIIEALNKNEKDSFILEGFQGEVIVADQEHFYNIIVQTRDYYSDYKIEKGSGIILKESHEQLEPEPDQEDNYVEIK